MATLHINAERLVLRRTPLFPAGHLPLKGGDQLLLRPSQIGNVAKQPRTKTLLISPLVGEMSGRTEGGV